MPLAGADDLDDRVSDVKDPLSDSAPTLCLSTLPATGIVFLSSRCYLLSRTRVILSQCLWNEK